MHKNRKRKPLRNKSEGAINLLFWLAAAFFVLAALPARATTYNWKASTTGDWSVAANWVEGFVPTNGDDAVITNSGVSVILSSASSNLSSLTLSRTLTFTNWDTYLLATNVSILSNGLMTCVGLFTNNAMSNRVYIICTNITIAAGGSISVDSRGYAGGYNAAGNGPGAGAQYCAASHGGRGGMYQASSPGAIYGLTNAPAFPGSGGGGWVSTTGGAGGGAIRIQANGTVTVDGTISADGQGTTEVATGAGSGGSIFITMRLLAGNGVMRARGGRASSGGAGAGCGGGGRIAVIYDTATQSTSAVPGIVFSVAGNYGGVTAGDSDAGTLFFSDNSFLQETFVHSGEWWVDGFTNWAPNNLFVSNGWLRIGGGGFTLSVTNAITVQGNNSSLYKLELSNAVVSCASMYVTSAVFRLGQVVTSVAALSCGGDIVLTNGARMHVYAAATNQSQPEYGALINVAGTLAIAPNAWLYSYSHETNGGSVWFQVNKLLVSAGGGISANSSGFMGRSNLKGLGPGGGQLYAGGGYGGTGGNYGVSGGGPTYGLSNAPVDPGSAGGGWSGGGGTPGGNGGGLIRVNANDTITVDGSLLANGDSTTAAATGAGSGGGIYLVTRIFSGNGGAINANAGSASSTGGGGGGGRIAIWRMYHSFTGTVSAALGTSGGVPGSTGSPGTAGTIFWGQIPVPGTIMTFK
ncbi:MAG: hypothetical protein HYV35_08445 [Lentisphaerae bacterium]|nr:hypothetical protein [Lentisphaerota bacterium]